nr:MAG TPA: hypothetical protein [Caudoviricetes sp.]
MFSPYHAISFLMVSKKNAISDILFLFKKV